MGRRVNIEAVGFPLFSLQPKSCDNPIHRGECENLEMRRLTWGCSLLVEP